MRLRFTLFQSNRRELYQKVVDWLLELVPQKAAATALVDRLIARIEADSLKPKRKKRRR
jgi:hypothetical protein